MVRRQNRSQSGSCQKKRACLPLCAVSLMPRSRTFLVWSLTYACRLDETRTARLACSPAREATPSDRGSSTTTEKSMPTSSGPSSSRKSGNFSPRRPRSCLLGVVLLLACLFFISPRVYGSWLSVGWRFKWSNLNALQFFSVVLAESLSRLRLDDLHRQPFLDLDNYSYRLRTQHTTRTGQTKAGIEEEVRFQAVPNSATERRKAVPQRKMRP